MPRARTIADRVRAFLHAAQPNSYCAQCLAASLALPLLYEGDCVRNVQKVMKTLPRRHFGTAVRECAFCQRRRPVVWALTPPGVT